MLVGQSIRWLLLNIKRTDRENVNPGEKNVINTALVSPHKVFFTTSSYTELRKQFIKSLSILMLENGLAIYVLSSQNCQKPSCKSQIGPNMRKLFPGRLFSETVEGK